MELISINSNAYVKITIFDGSFLSRHLASAPSRNVIAPSTIKKNNRYYLIKTVLAPVDHGAAFDLDLGFL